MDNFKYRYIILLSLFIGILFSACKDNWDEHNAISDPILTVNLMAQINKNPDLSTFSSYLVKTGYDKVVASSKTFTIWAPTNLALANLDPAIVNDTAQLRKFVAYHISNQTYLTSSANPLLKIRTLNGKNILFTKTTFEEANIVAADRYVGNGVLHTIDMATIPKLNAWEYLNNSATSMQKTYLQKLNYQYRDLTLAEVIGVDPTTGDKIYKENTGYSSRNQFLQRSTDISREDSTYTYVILTDDAFGAEKTKLSKYFNIVNDSATALHNTNVRDSLTNWNIVKDLTFKGCITIDNLPDTLISKDSLKIHIDKNWIVETHKVSNGIVYVVNRIDYKMSSKFRPIVIQGEYTYGNYGNNGTRSTILWRDPVTLKDSRELYYYDSGISSYWVSYGMVVNSVKYKVYWKAVRNFNLTATAPAVPVLFSQRLSFGHDSKYLGGTALYPGFPYVVVPLSNYDEVYLADLNFTGYGFGYTYLVSANSTTKGVNSLVLDYIKMVPILN